MIASIGAFTQREKPSVLVCTGYSSSDFAASFPAYILMTGMKWFQAIFGFPLLINLLILSATLKSRLSDAACEKEFTRMSLSKVSQCLIVVSGLAIFDVNLFSDTLTVQATADIYAAGHASLPATVFPGTFPPSASFAAGPNQILTFSSVTGMVGCNFAITNGPDGTCFPGVNTTVTSYGGLSGISAKNANLFLVGVFLNATEPSGPGPSVLSYDYGTAGSLNTTDATFSPVISQVFFIGDGLTGTGSGQEQVFNVPDDASRLYLGFADSFDSVPSFYADNVGSLSATFAITSAPEPGSLFLITGGLLIGVSVYRRKSRPS